MGVSATYCQLCGLPVQHDHYVPEAGGGLLKIYRGSSPGGGHAWAPGEAPFPFGAEHAWLRNAVALCPRPDRVLRGTCCDGVLTQASGAHEYVGDGAEDGLVFHHACWERLGRPQAWADARTARGTHAFAQVAPYQEQLFEFAELAADGQAWLLEDPATSARSAERLAALVREARSSGGDEATTVEALVRADADWHAVTTRGDGHVREAIVRFRARALDVDHAGYADAVWVDKAFAPAPGTLAELEQLERELKAVAEEDAQAVLVSVILAADAAHYLFYARDGEATLSRVEAWPRLDVVAESGIGTQADPSWRMHAERLGRR